VKSVEIGMQLDVAFMLGGQKEDAPLRDVFRDGPS
jgi:hypothetical protein